MNQETMLLVKGQQMIMEILMTMMPEVLSDNWRSIINEHNNLVIEYLQTQGFDTVDPEA